MTDHGAAALRIEHIVKHFGAFTALNDVSLAINKGELVCFLGPSGCGKTTLLRIIAGLEVQTSGAILQNGRDISRLPPMMRDYGIVFQSYALFPNLTIYDNVAYGLVNRRLSKAAIRERVAELLTLIGLADSGAGQWYVYGHLVAIEVGVERGAHQRVYLDGAAIDKHRLKGLNRQAVQGGGAVQ